MWSIALLNRHFVLGRTSLTILVNALSFIKGIKIFFNVFGVTMCNTTV